MSKVLSKASLASSIFLIQLKNFRIIERGLLFTLSDIYLSSFPSEEIDLGELTFEGGVTVIGVVPAP